MKNITQSFFCVFNLNNPAFCADFLIDSGANINFIESDDSLDDRRMPVPNMAVMCAVMFCRHGTRLELENRIMITEHSSKEESDESYYILKKLLESGADVKKNEVARNYLR